MHRFRLTAPTISGHYSKMWAALLVWIAGAVPTLLAFHTWKEVVAYAVPGIASVVAVYLVPNTTPVVPVVTEE